MNNKNRRKFIDIIILILVFGLIYIPVSDYDYVLMSISSN